MFFLYNTHDFTNNKRKLRWIREAYFLKRSAMIIIGFMIAIFLSSCTQDEKPVKEEKNISIEEKGNYKTSNPYVFTKIEEPSDKVNFLIVGVDSRGEKKSRSDVIMIAQYHKKSHHLRLVSIMRDSYVAIPAANLAHPQNKINVAYYLGGPELLRKTIMQNFGIDIHHYIEIDFQGFAHVVDLLAPEGISVDLTPDIIADMGMQKKPGIQKLHGRELLDYARFRHDAQSDFGRIARQQEVLLALKNTLFSQISTFQGIMTLPQLARDLSEYVSTDLSIEEVIKFASELSLHPIEKVETLRIPVENGFINKRVEHAGLVLELKEEMNQEAMKSFLIEAPTPVNQK